MVLVLKPSNLRAFPCYCWCSCRPGTGLAHYAGDLRRRMRSFPAEVVGAAAVSISVELMTVGPVNQAFRPSPVRTNRRALPRIEVGLGQSIRDDTGAVYLR